MGENLNSRQKSIIDRCVRKLYIEIARNREKYEPIMSDFYEILMNQPEDCFMCRYAGRRIHFRQ